MSKSLNTFSGLKCLNYTADKDDKERAKTFWHSATEPNFDVDEFER